MFDSATAIENTDVESDSPPSEYFERVSASPHFPQTAKEATAQSEVFCQLIRNPSPNCSYLSGETTSSKILASSSFLEKNLFSATAIFRHHRPGDTMKSTLCGDVEDTLFMYYLDEVFHIQYPFYQSSKRLGRGWLFSILRRVKSAYHASLALSEYHLYLTRSHYSNICNVSYNLRAKGGHYDLALQEMQLCLAQSHIWSGTTGLIRSVEALTAILQLLFWEVRVLSSHCPRY